MSQLSAADREVHAKLAEKTRAGLPMGPNVPLDQHMESALALPSVMWLLMPKPRSVAPEKNNPAAPGNPAAKRPWESLDKKGKGKGGRFDKIKNKKLSKTPMPLQLRGGTPVDAEGRSICYG